MSNVHSGYSRHFKSRRPRLRFADDIIRKSSKPAAGTTPRDVQSSAEEGESVGSDDAAPAMSEVSNSFSSRTDFTAIFKVANQVRAMAGNLSIASLHSLAEILISCLESTLRSLKLLPSRIRSALNFGVAFRGVIFSGGMFSHHVGRVTTRLSGIQLTEAVQLSLQSLDMTMASLKTLLDLVECSDTQGKLPLDISGGSDVALVIPQTSVEYPPIPTIASADNVPVRKTLLEAQRKLNDPILRTRMIPTKSSLRQLVSGLGSKGTIRPLTLWSGTVSLRSSSTAPPVDGLPGGPYLATPTTPTTPGLSDSDGSYQQAHHNGVVVSTPPTTEQSPKRINLQVLNVELPLSPNELYFSHNGVLCAASLEALVRILTSSEAVRDPSFDVFFFFSFRFFSKPLEIFNLLVEQYDERPPEGLQPAQVNLWEQNAPVAKVRVAKVFLLWLRSYWRYQWDMDVLEPLRQFASDRPTNDPASITWDKVTRNVNDASVGVRQGFRMQRIAQIVSEHQSTRLSRPFELLTEEMMSQGDFDKVDVLYFHNPPGREEFARQLCLAASGLFRHIDPEDAVRYWRNGQNKTVGEKISCLASFENALSYWVSNAIVVRPTVRSRAEVMEFFIDLASVSILPYQHVNENLTSRSNAWP